MKLEFGLQTREELDEASAIMARAYEDYDYVTLYFRDAEKSRKGVQIFMNCVLKANYGKADLLAAHRDGKLVARATLEAPGFKKPSAFQYIIHGFWRVYLNTKWSEINGFVAMDEGASKPCHDFQKSGPDIWYQHARSRPICTRAGRRFAIFNLYGRLCTRTRRQAVGAIHKFKRKPRFLQQARIRGFPRM